ncbi:MAG: prpB [Thermoleophilia bacterium]|jgi:methylisocitrate lyase|nr:prpB [Thermoleophilia bacterium]
MTGPGIGHIDHTQRRRDFRAALASGTIQKFPGAFSPLVAQLIEDLGSFEGVYVSGAALSADLGLPDIGLTTLTEVATRSEQIARMTRLPVFVDADTGFGEPLNLARTINTLEGIGLAGCHIEDQVNPKRCGHLDNKSIVSRDAMVQRVRAAVQARRDDQFVIMARTDAKASEGIEAAIERAKAYVDAGADAIFPEALHTEAEFEQFRAAVDVPLLANMTEFGKSDLIPAAKLQELGYEMVIYPVTTLRIAMGAIERGLRTIAKTGTQESVVPEMQTRARLYELIEYEKYNEFDSGIFDFTLAPH